MFKVGLTGNIGSGKTTVANIFGGLGIDIIDADEIAHEITQPNTHIFNEIIERFGDELIKNDSLDRKKLREIIFSETHHKIWLEQLMHPPIINIMQEKSENVSSQYCLLVIPLLIEKKLFNLVDYVLVVTADNRFKIERSTKRDKSHQKMVESITKSQLPIEKTKKYADHIIYNNSDIPELTKQVELLHSKLLKLSNS